MWSHKEEKIMVRKVNYNNPIMQEYIKKGQNINTGSKYSYSTMKGFGLVNPSHTTIIYQGFSDSSSPTTTTSTSKSSSNEMTTAEKWAAGIQIGAATIKGAAEIIEAIADVKAKSAANPAPASTKSDATEYAVTARDESASLSKSEFKTEKKDAKSMGQKITDEISNYKKTGDKTGLVDAVTTAKASYDANTKKIETKEGEVTSAEEEYNTAKDAYEEYHKGEYKTAKENVKTAEDTYRDTKKTNDSKISDLEKEYTGCEQTISKLDNDISAKEGFIERMKAKDDLTPEESAKLEEAEQELEEMKKQKQDAENRMEEIGKKGSGKGEIGELEADTKAKQDAMDELKAKFTNEIEPRHKELNDSMELSHSEFKRIESENKKEISQLKSLNDTLKSPIEKGQKALGSYSV